MPVSCDANPGDHCSSIGLEIRHSVWLKGSLTAILLVTLVVFPQWVLAQGTSAIQGHISDASGASVPKALIRATNESTGVSRTTYSAEDGYYRVGDLLPGSYELRVELSGFKTLRQSGITISAESMTGLNFTLEVGEVTQTVDVTGEEPQIETEIARISEVINENEVRSLPVQGRGVMNLALISPGVQGKAETFEGGFFCCDAFSNYKGLDITSGGSENKSNYTLDGLTLRYGGGSYWGALFTPNIDAVNEVRISTNPSLAETGTISGPTVNFISKGGTNDWHGSAHFTNIDDALNAKPYFASEKPDVYTRYFGATAGGPIIKNRLFVFGGYQGLREKTVQNAVEVAETQAFRDLVVQTRPNSIAASILQQAAPFRYPTGDLVDVGSPGADGIWTAQPDGIPDLGLLSVDNPNTRKGKQFNVRVDYHSPSANDRIFGAYWYTRPDALQHYFASQSRDLFKNEYGTVTKSVNVVHAHSFSPQSLNEFRFGVVDLVYTNSLLSNAYHIPGIATDDGLYLGSHGWSREFENDRTMQFGNMLSLDRGRHSLKMGAHYRRSTTDAASLGPSDVPEYYFASILDFANDNPYLETRTLDFTTGKPANPSLAIYSTLNEFSLFLQDTWKVTPNFTLNLGLRWDNFFSNWLGRDRNNWQPVLTSDQLDPNSIVNLKSVKVDRFYRTDWNNFGPRLGMAWDPTGQRKMSIRAGFGILYDEIAGSTPVGNPPVIASVAAGPDLGIPVVYGLAPTGTLDYPPNPNLPLPQLNEAGGILGSRVNISGIVQDLEVPLVWDMFGGVQYELTTDLKVEFDYKYRRTTNDRFSIDRNRFNGDLLDGVRDRLNPFFNSIGITSNFGRRISHGLIASASKRFSRGWSFNASYSYYHAKTNLIYDRRGAAYRQLTDPLDPLLDYARDDIPHVFTVHSVWELPILRGKSGWLAGAFGGWQFNTIWNFQSGPVFTPISNSSFANGGDFNADGRTGDRPDRPSDSVATSFSKQQWLDGAISGSVFPLPDPASPRPGTLPADFFRGPGYARIDSALLKNFPVGWREGAYLQFRAEAFNLFNRLNISTVDSGLESASFARAVGAYQNRVFQLSLKFVF